MRRSVERDPAPVYMAEICAALSVVFTEDQTVQWLLASNRNLASQPGGHPKRPVVMCRTASGRRRVLELAESLVPQ